MYLARTLVSRYGGTIRVTDNDPTGAIFEITLPTAAPPDEDDAFALLDTDSDTSIDTDADDGADTSAPRGDGDGDRTDTGDAGGDDSTVDPRLVRLRSVLDR